MPGPVHTPEILETASLLQDPALYLDREPSLLAFQRRVLEEAQDGDNRLLERVKLGARGLAARNGECRRRLESLICCSPKAVRVFSESGRSRFPLASRYRSITRPA